MSNSIVTDLIKMINLIHLMTEEPKTVAQLKEEMSTTERTVYRTMHYLRANGIEIEKSRDKRTANYRIKAISIPLKDSIKNLHDKVHRLNA